MLIIHAGFTIDSAKHEEFLKEISPLIDASRAEEGNISYDLYKHTEKENVYTMVEVWQDLQAVESHNKSSHFTSFTAAAGNFLTAPLDVKVFNGEPLKR
ncbi:Quinol monooxygenase YgiN [Bacillus sp. OV322]|uniref:putative quinol monooxygenase n=1 Tax=Bacillus sp. OV322 TaxID=1882764 RepID=UPI0008E48115|nr:putative quinol monooxygenase [Bacillus sp. OV322]SFC66073.1 Quinol monooxygenase YgiN [Bacillus sp. OV322]